MPYVKEDIINEFKLKCSEILKPLKIIDMEYDKDLPSGIDMRIKVGFNDEESSLLLSATSNSEPRYVEQSISRLKMASSSSPEFYPIYLSYFIGKRSRSICRKLGVGYIDLNGNILISMKNLHIEKESDKNITKEKKELKRMFSPVSTRIIRKLLVRPKDTWTTKSLSVSTGVSIGYTHRVTKKLITEGFLVRDQNYRLKLLDPNELLDLWREEYSFKMNTIYPFYTFQKDEEKILNEIDGVSEKNGMEYGLTLHYAGNLIYPFVRSKDLYFYISSSIDKWIRELDLRPVESGGNIHIVKPYDPGVIQDIQEINGHKVVSDVQLYLDLYNYPGRGREQANRIREKKLGY